MDSLFVRSVALSLDSAVHCVVNASRSTVDGTFAVASSRDGIIRVYAASCGALLHEFSSIHKRIHALHYTSFSDSLVTLESDVVARPKRNAGDHDAKEGHDQEDTSDDDHEEEEEDGLQELDETETFLCVYHDWRESRRVRGYTLPLGVLESAASRRKADCVAVCSFSGRVVVAMGTVINIWQCSQGFFEHVMEIKVEMSQQHAFLLVEYVAIHGVYVAYASQTEVRVMEINVRSSKELENAGDTTKGSVHTGKWIEDDTTKALATSGSLLRGPNHQEDVPDDSTNCVNVRGFGDLQELIEIPVVSSSSRASNKMEDLRTNQQQSSNSFLEDQQEESPVVLARDEAQQEAYHLAGLVKEQDIRVNQALDYYVGQDDVTVLLRRYLPPNHRLQALRFLPETIDNRLSSESRSYARLLVATERNAFLYYFLSAEVDATREDCIGPGMHEPIRMGNVVVGQDRDFFASMDDQQDPSTGNAVADFLTESGRVVMQYTFTSPMCCITANSSFLFAATLSGLQIWSIWSPCHHIAASKALSKTLVPQPTQPQLLCTQQLPFVASDIAALDSCVILLPHTRLSRKKSAGNGQDLVRIASLVAEELLPDSELELRGAQYNGPLGDLSSLQRRSKPNILIFLQSPPSRVFAFVRENILQRQTSVSSLGDGNLTGDMAQLITTDQIDLLLSLFSLYRYRANVGMELLEYKQAGRVDPTSDDDDEQKHVLSLELETRLYDSLARDCAAELANVFTSVKHLNLKSAALLYVASNLAAPEVLRRLSEVMQHEQVSSGQVMEATAQYLEGFVFPTSDMTSSLGNKLLSDRPLQSGSSRSSPPSSSSSSTPSFTRAVLMHYGDNAPEQISRIVVDSSLEWTLQDIQFGLEKLTEASESTTNVLIKVATLVLVLRASGFAKDQWNEFDQKEELEPLCDYKAIRKRVLDLHVANHGALIHLCRTHPDLLVVARDATYVSPKDISRQLGLESGKVDVCPSVLAQALLETVPFTLETILEHIFEAAIQREELILRATLFCCSVFGEPALQSLEGLRTAGRGNDTEALRAPKSDDASGCDVFTLNEASLMRFMFFLLGRFSWLNQLQDQDHLQENVKDLEQVKHAICHEFIRLCVKLYVRLSSLSTKERQESQDQQKLENRFGELFTTEDHLAMATVRDILPSWVHDFVKERCLSRLEGSDASLPMINTLHHLLLQALALVPFMNAMTLVSVYEKAQEPDDLSTLIALLAYPQASRTIDGLALIGKRSDFLSLFLPYGKCFCNTLEEWRFLIKSLASVSQETKAEKAILESILNHVCSTLNTEELLQVLPDDGDLALYIASVENSLRLNEARDKAIQKTQPANDDDLFFDAARNHLGSIVP